MRLSGEGVNPFFKRKKKTRKVQKTPFFLFSKMGIFKRITAAGDWIGKRVVGGVNWIGKNAKLVGGALAAAGVAATPAFPIAGAALEGLAGMSELIGEAYVPLTNKGQKQVKDTMVPGSTASTPMNTGSSTKAQIKSLKRNFGGLEAQGAPMSAPSAKKQKKSAPSKSKDGAVDTTQYATAANGSTSVARVAATAIP